MYQDGCSLKIGVFYDSVEFVDLYTVTHIYTCEGPSRTKYVANSLNRTINTGGGGSPLAAN